MRHTRALMLSRALHRRAPLTSISKSSSSCLTFRELTAPTRPLCVQVAYWGRKVQAPNKPHDNLVNLLTCGKNSSAFTISCPAVNTEHPMHLIPVQRKLGGCVC